MTGYLETLKKNECGMYVGENGCSYEDGETAIHEGVFGFCGCGEPWVNLKNVCSYLSLVQVSRQISYEEIDKVCENLWGKSGRDLFLILAYVCDKAGLTEHGSSVNRSWLNEKGEMILHDLKNMELDR